MRCLITGKSRREGGGDRDSLSCGGSPRLCCVLPHRACAILPRSSLSNLCPPSSVPLAPGRVDIYSARYAYGVVLNDQYAGFSRPEQTSLETSQFEEDNAAAATMSRAVLFISVFTIFLDVLHASQVRFFF
ncbi:hypothetical protein RR48_03897 [Papilio machaon]|uniref:Uncharacterized protein n=1 Tax=Papilio machaon TaxID=76193 RepID=A0A0N0PC22_PAPMA|nr:hypothetical protein RR48_03897 [Papilio machaon]